MALLLDSITTKLACDLKKLRTAYAGACLRVRRSSDDNETDIGFDSNGNLDWASAAAFGANLFVSKLYDQSGNGINLVQTVSAKQSALDQTNKQINFDGADDFLVSSTTVDLSAVNTYSAFIRAKTDVASGAQIFFEHSENLNGFSGAFGVYRSGAEVDAVFHGTDYDVRSQLSVDIAFHTYSIIADRAAAANGDKWQSYFDGAVFNAGGSIVGNQSNGGNYLVYVGARGGTSLFVAGAFKGFILTATAVTIVQRNAIEASLGVQATAAFAFVTTSPLPQATVGRPYSQTIQTSNGVTPLNAYAPAITAGALPSGLAIGFAAANNATDSALISGTSSAAGTSVFTVRVRDADFKGASKEFSITVNAAVAITSPSGALAGGTVGTVYSGAVPTRTGGTAGYIWSISSGSLPNGLNLDADGKPVGTATTAGTFAFTRRVTDANGSFAEQSHTIAVVAPASPPPTASFTKSASSGNAPLAVNFSDTSTGTPTAWSWNFGDGNTSTAQNPFHTFAASGTYTVTLSASNSSGSTQTTQTIIVTEAAALPLGFNRAGLQLLVIPNEMTPTNGTSATSLTDYTDYARHLTAASGYPTFQTAVQNSKAVVRFSGSDNPLKNAAAFTVACGWMVVKHTGAAFGDFEGVLSGLGNVGILVGGGAGATTFFNFLDDYYEYRLNDRIYPKENAPAPMGGFKLIFFRFWQPITVDGVQIGQDRTFTTRKFTGDIALLALSSRSFCEKEIRAQSQRIADYFALTLADVIPYQGMKSDEVISGRAANVYDPPEGNRIVEVIGNYNQSFNLTFGNRGNKEFKAMREYHKAHYPIPETAYRDYNVLPPEDVEGYIDSPLRKSGAINNISYSFSFKGK